MKVFIQNLRLSRKLIIAPGVMMVFLLIFAVASYVGLRRQQDALEFFVTDELRSSVMVNAASQNIAESQGNLYKMITWGQAGFDQSKIDALGKAQFADVDSAIGLLKALVDSTAEPFLKEKYSVAGQDAEKYRKSVETVVDLGSVDMNSATMAMVTAEERFADLSAKLKEARDIEAQTSNDAYSSATAGYHNALWMFLIVLLLGVSLSVAVTMWVTTIISDPLQAVNRILGRVADGNDSLKDNAQRIADGDASVIVSIEPEEVTIHQKDEVGLLAESTRKIVASQAELAAAFQKVAETLDALMKETSSLAASAVQGKLSARGDETRFRGGYQAIVKGVNDTLDAVIGPLNMAAQYVDAISKGNIPKEITDEYHGDFNTIKDNLNLCIAAVNALVADARTLSEGAVDGKLSIRADAGKHQGDFRKVVEGVNATLDALTGPVAVAAESIDRISKGEIPEKIVEDYRGEFNTLKDNLNRCVDGLGGLVEANAVLQRMAVNDYTVKVEGSYPGTFADLAKATNEVHAHLIRLLSIAKNISRGDLSDLAPLKATGGGKGRRCDNDELVPAYVQMEEAIKRLVDDTGSLSGAAVEGRLSSRANVGNHQGEFRKVLEGVNETLDAVIKPVEDGGRVLEMIAAGDLSARVTAEYHGDHRKIVASINEVASSLDQALAEVAEAVSATASASSEISASTEEMAAGAQEQTSQAAQVASAVEEMTKTILENSQNASATATVAKQAKTSAESGGAIVSETVSGMRRIAKVVERSAETVKELGKSSDQIGEIVTVIDDIADQTNLLALNAAIEAARAGDQGRGFAVVADEVRKLAERTTKATKEIAGMIQKIQTETQGAVTSMEEGTKQVDAGIRLADQAGSSLKEIVDVSQRVTDMVMQIAVASEQQSSASEQITKNVEAISSVTHQTAGGTQQIARAANDLNSLTENLQRLIGKFQLTADHGPAPDGDREGRSTIAVRANGKLVRH